MNIYLVPAFLCCLAATHQVVSDNVSPTTSSMKKIDSPCNATAYDEYYNREDGKCYKRYEKATCPDTMVFNNDNTATNEFYDTYKTYAQIGKCACEKSFTQYPCRDFPVLYSQEKNRCYEMYTQGPCKTGEWFTPSPTYNQTQQAEDRLPGICTPNVCEKFAADFAGNFTTTRRHIYLLNGTCYETNTQAHCDTLGHVSYFSENSPEPKCGDADDSYSLCGTIANFCEIGQLYHAETGSCYNKNSQGPCPDSMILALDPTRGETKYYQQFGRSIQFGECVCKAAMEQYPCRSFPVLFSQEKNRCYELYSQGPCKVDEWFIPTLPLNASILLRHPGKCEKNVCKTPVNSSATSPSGSVPKRNYLHNGKCYETSTRGHCADPDHVAFFEQNYPIPDCGDTEKVYGGCKEAKICKPGEVYHEASNECYPQDSQGPCSESMSLRFEDKERSQNYLKQFGIIVKFAKCDCQLSRPSGGCSYRPFLFSGTAQKCFPAFSQGPCLESEWFRTEPYKDYSKEGRLPKGVCEHNPCLTSRPPAPFNLTIDQVAVFYFGSNVANECLLAGTHGNCPVEEEVLYFSENDMNPSCGFSYVFESTCTRSAGFSINIGSGSLGCPPNYVKRGQDCTRRADF